MTEKHNNPTVHIATFMLLLGVLSLPRCVCRPGGWWAWRFVMRDAWRAWTLAAGLRRVELMGGPLDGRLVRWPSRCGQTRRLPLCPGRHGWGVCGDRTAEVVSHYTIDAYFRGRASHVLDVAKPPRSGVRQGVNVHG